MNKIVRAVIYARYSSDNQREESTTAQLRAGREYIERKKYLYGGEYIDEEKTGKNDRREDFQRMISDAKAGLFDVIVIHKINRFARNRYDSVIYKRELKRNDVRVESVTEQLDDSPESVILESLLEGMAEYQSLDLAREVMKGLRENAELGIHTGGTATYGLKVDPETKRYEIDERTFLAVQIYFDGILNDWSNSQIADSLNSQGYRTSTGKRFTKNSFYGWASNAKYKGDYTWNTTSPKNQDGTRNSHRKRPIEEQIIKPGIIPAIIDSDKWQRVNVIMDERKKKPGKMKSRAIYLLTGKIFCDKCGAPYTGNSYSNGKSGVTYYYYKCAQKCGGASVRKDEIEKEVIDRLLENCFTDDAILSIVKRVKELYNEQRGQYKNNAVPIKQEIRELETKISNWIELAGAGVKTVLENIKGAEQRKETLISQLKRAELLNSTFEIKDQDIISVLNEKKHLLYSSDEEMKKQVLQEYVDKIIVQPRTDIAYNVEITYRVFSGAGEGT